jgi:hypothetical protein
VVVIAPPPSPFPDVEQKKTSGLVSVIATHGPAVRATLTLLSYLVLPVLVFILLPEALKPLSMITAAFSGHKILMHDMPRGNS